MYPLELHTLLSGTHVSYTEMAYPINSYPLLHDRDTSPSPGHRRAIATTRHPQLRHMGLFIALLMRQEVDFRASSYNVSRRTVIYAGIPKKGKKIVPATIVIQRALL